jgi:hypothetical protein
VSAILGLFALGQALAGQPRIASLAAFAAGAIVPTLILLAYNKAAFGTVLDLGYAHHIIPRFRQVHSRSNPLGIGLPQWDLAVPLLVGEYRGLLTYAPIVALAPVGWIALLRARKADVLLVSLSACLAVFLVNLSYPEWTGGWSTGPRLLVPMLPFAMIAVAAALAVPGPIAGRAILAVALIATLIGTVVVMLCQGVGGRIPDALEGGPLLHPLSRGVVHLWSGQRQPDWWIGGRFVRNLVSIAWPAVNDPGVVPPSRQWLQFVPLWIAQAGAIGWLLHRSREVKRPTA